MSKAYYDLYFDNDFYFYIDIYFDLYICTNVIDVDIDSDSKIIL